MKRTTIVADDQTMATLKRLAEERGVSFSEVVREALAEKARELRVKPRSLGVGKAARSNTAAVLATRRIPPRSWR
jgi:predicted CopG family antitoxin